MIELDHETWCDFHHSDVEFVPLALVLVYDAPFLFIISRKLLIIVLPVQHKLVLLLCFEYVVISLRNSY